MPPSGERQSDPGCHGGDPSLQEVLQEGGWGGDSAPATAGQRRHPWPLNPASKPLRKDFFLWPTVKKLRKSLDHA